MELYFAWSLYKYVMVALIIALGVIIVRVFAPLLMTSDLSKIDSLKKRVFYVGIGLYIFFVVLSINTGKSVYNADKTDWNLPTIDVQSVPVNKNNNVIEAQKKLDENTEKLLDSVSK